MPHLHNCYFHDHSIITHFCTRPQCTLPMCERCLPIHLQEHQGNSSQNQGIISFNQAEQRAIQGLKKTLAAQSSIKAGYVNKMQEVKTKMIELIDQIFTEFKTQIDQECGCVSQIQKKLTKIQKGSLKTLIYFYTEQQKSINKSVLDLKAAQLQRIKSSFIKIVEQQRNPRLHKVTVISQQKIPLFSPKQQNKKPQIFQYQGRERGYSMSTANNKTTMDRSASYQKLDRVQKVETIHQNKYSYQEASLKMKSDASFKALPSRNFADRPEYNPNTDYLYTDQYAGQTKIATQSQRQRQIQSIRLREEQKQRERQRQKQQKQRKQKLEMQRQKQKQRENEQALLRMNQKIDYQKNRIQEHNTQNDKKSTRLSDRTNHAYQYVELEKSNAGNYKDIKKDNSIYIRNQSEAIMRKPLEISDLNIETKYSKYANGIVETSQIQNRGTKFNDNGFPINKQVLSPDQIRKMLQKRIQQRSRLISKNKSVSLLKNSQQSLTKSQNKSKDIMSNNYGGQMQGRWDTKDSIINQIYEDYRY